MLKFFTGKPGSGKSLHCAQIIDTYLRAGKNVIANFEINETFYDKRKKKGKKIGNFYAVPTEQLTVKYLADFCRKNHRQHKNGGMIEGQTLVVVDECAYKWNSRSWNAPDRPKWCNLFRQHRKFGFDFILVSQSFEDIDKQIRGLCLYEYNHRNVGKFKLFGAFLAFICGGFLCCVVVRNMDTKQKDHAEWFVGKRKYYRFYDSYKLFDMSDFV